MQWSWGTYKTVENGGFLWYDSAEYFSEEYSMVNVCDIEVMKPLLAVHGFHFSKAKGQNFLIAPWVPESIARESGACWKSAPASAR